MIRLWHRVGTFRALSVLVLVAGLVGGLVIAGRQTQHKASAEPVRAADAAALQRAGAGSSASAAPLPDPSASSPEQVAAQSKAQDAASAAAAQAKAAEDAARKKKDQEASRSTPRAAYPAPASCAVYGEGTNKNKGCTLMVAAGFGLDQMPCLEKLWDKESHWNPNAHNNGSGAHGIPQAVPGDKMAAYGPNWKTDPATQIKWGLSYIKGRYKTPCGAWGHSQSTGWY